MPVNLPVADAQVGVRPHILVQRQVMAIVARITDSGQQVWPDVVRMAGTDVGRAGGEIEVSPLLTDCIVPFHHLDTVFGEPGRLSGVVWNDFVVIFPNVNTAVGLVTVNARLFLADVNIALRLETAFGQQAARRTRRPD
jgi:hypothetical protein